MTSTILTFVFWGILGALNVGFLSLLVQTRRQTRRVRALMSCSNVYCDTPEEAVGLASIVFGETINLQFTLCTTCLRRTTLYVTSGEIIRHE